jgi:FkbM family methyltransferase
MGRQKLEPGTDDTGVLEQLKRLYSLMGQTERTVISIDVGAYIGVISLAMSQFGPPKHFIHCFEADDLNYSRLKQNISPLSHATITPHNKAVANYVGFSKFTRYKDPVNNHLGTEHNRKDILDSFHQVSVTTLDVFVDEAGIDIIDVLKIDVEGFDLSVLHGAKNILEKNQIKVIIIETPTHAQERNELKEFLENQGFTSAYIVRNSTELTEISESAFSRHDKTPLNILAIKSELADQLDTKVTVV